MGRVCQFFCNFAPIMLLLPLYYLAPIGYYSQVYRSLASGDGFRFDPNDRWEKQTLRSRCYIASPQGRMMLSFPVQHTEGAEERGTLLSSHGNWQHQHWNALVSSYRQSPFFDYYADDFAPHFVQGAHTTRQDFCTALHNVVMECLGLSELPPIYIHLSASYEPKEYYQVFKSRTGFLPDLSIVDLLFNMGPEARLFL